MNKCFTFRKLISKVILLTLLVTLSLSSSVFAANDNLYSYDPQIFSFTDDEDLMAKIINSDQFISDHAGLADLLGFGWCGGTRSQYVGEDFEFKKLGDGKYSLKARYNSNDTYADGYMADTRLEMIIDNVSFYVDGDTLEFGEHKLSDLKPVKVYDSYVTNESEYPVIKYPRLTYTTDSSWSRTDDVSFGQSLEIKNKYKFDIGIMGNETEITAKLDFGQGWSDTKSGSETLTAEERLQVTVAPYSKNKVEMVMLKDKVDLPYTSNIYMDYDITYKGFLRWGGNALNLHPDNRPMKEMTFGEGSLSAAEDIYDQYIHRDINGYSEWDWEWIYDQGKGDRLVRKLSSIVNRPRGGINTGIFECISGAICKSTVGETEPLDGTEGLDSDGRVKRSATQVYLDDQNVYEVPGVEVISIILEDE